MRTFDNRFQQFDHLLDPCYRHPRSLVEAWPCTPTGLSIPHKRMKPAEKLFCWVVGAIGLVAVALMVAGVIT